MDDEDDFIPANGSSVFLIDTWTPPERDTTIKSLWEWYSPSETPLRISISGAAGTGKKMLAETLSGHLGIPAIESIPRTVKEMGGSLNKTSDMLDEFMMFIAQMYEQSEYPEFISAGSLVDVVAHMTYVADKSGGKRDRRIVDAAANLIHMISVHSYSVAIYLPLRKKPRADGVRSVDMKYLAEIDRLTKFYLESFDIDFLPVEGKPSVCATTIMSYLKEFDLLEGRNL
jgi:hypothetical protein